MLQGICPQPSLRRPSFFAPSWAAQGDRDRDRDRDRGCRSVGFTSSLQRFPLSSSYTTRPNQCNSIHNSILLSSPLAPAPRAALPGRGERSGRREEGNGRRGRAPRNRRRPSPATPSQASKQARCQKTLRCWSPCPPCASLPARCVVADRRPGWWVSHAGCLAQSRAPPDAVI